ncbi:type II toxin-antitoxin system prevent-host-death family antitoxin [Streptomyces sp. WAC07061]|uniref:type II toxin-antitoxin system Phd/YefM family antitoxin n=1 Tax=Streptomyces sp. WAC07061 TaxID=2487410 RepID=UPI000F7BAF24|nr:type II toxin-antitoxin system prevent-host-death family antitoxin [Streptomyces sp. WAC07061]RSS60432.1 type II toxin-antitoxin system prevent-host-death family antitoxin [Streptomyces sp. WAC07061]
MSISANEARQRFYPLIRQVNEDHVPIEVTSREHGDVVIMSAEDFRSWQETVYLLRSPRNAQILMDSIAELDAGHGQARELIGEEDDDVEGSAA